MDLGLKGKIALVTGGSRGIGLACAKMLAAEGGRVVLCSQANIDTALTQLPNAVGIAADLSSADEARRVVETVWRDAGPLDILVNCAGAAKRTPPEELTAEAWRGRRWTPSISRTSIPSMLSSSEWPNVVRASS